MQNCPPAGRIETPQEFFFILFYPEVFFFYIIIIFFIIQPALLGVLNTESSTQASDPTRNKFVCVCVCVSAPIYEKVVAFFSIPYIGTGRGLEPETLSTSATTMQRRRAKTTRPREPGDFNMGKLRCCLC